MIIVGRDRIYWEAVQNGTQNDSTLKKSFVPDSIEKSTGRDSGGIP